jgi:hypothetical protein
MHLSMLSAYTAAKKQETVTRIEKILTKNNGNAIVTQGSRDKAMLAPNGCVDTVVDNCAGGDQELVRPALKAI